MKTQRKSLIEVMNAYVVIIVTFILAATTKTRINPFEIDIGIQHVSFAILCALIHFVLSIAMHELGHLVCGLLTGYKFLSIRVFNHECTIDEFGKLTIAKRTFHGSLGQCLMTPPIDSNKPFFWYLFGGILFNIIGMILSVIGMLLTINPGYIVFFAIGALTQFLSGFVNWIPLQSSPNDGQNIRDIIRDSRNLESFYQILRVNYELMKGKRLTSLDFSQIENLHLNGTSLLQINALQLLYTYQTLSESYDNARQTIEKLLEILPARYDFLIIMLRIDQYFLDLLQCDLMKTPEKTIEVERGLKHPAFHNARVCIELLEQVRQHGFIDQVLYDRFLTVNQYILNRGYAEDVRSLIDSSISQFMTLKSKNTIGIGSSHS